MNDARPAGWLSMTRRKMLGYLLLGGGTLLAGCGMTGVVERAKESSG